MTQQLDEIISDEAGRSYLSPNGFVENFRSRAGSGPILPTDVLGYYDGQDLPFAAFLADHYATCERFFASHPGPTLPNRMLWLTGDVQYDRTGEAILNNNDGENFRHGP